MLTADVKQTLIVFGTLTTFVLSLFLILRAVYSYRVVKFSKMHPEADLEAIQKGWAQLNVHLAIVGDLGEFVAWFKSQRRTRAELESASAVLLESACEGCVLDDTYTRGRFVEWDGEKGELVPFAQYIGKDVPEFSGSHFAPGEGAPGKAFQTGEVVIIDNFADANPEIKDAWKRPYKSVVCVPVPTIPDPSQRIGVLNFDAPVTDYFTDEHVRLLRSVSNYLFIMYRHVMPETEEPNSVD